MAPTTGKLTLIHGPMFSGKTTRLINLVKKDKHSLAIKPSIDDRYSEKAKLVSHDQEKANAVIIDASNPAEINQILKTPNNRTIETVLIDESNFFDDQLIGVIVGLKSDGKNVVVAGLTLDSEKNDFGPTKKLIKIADRVEELYARCDYKTCRVKARFTYAKKPKQSQLVVGASDLYGPACQRHYPKLHTPARPKSDLIEYGVYPPFVEWLSEMELPYLRQPSPDSSAIRIEVGADSMRVGKTTAVKIIAEGLKELGYKVTTSFEDIKGNPHLKKSYSDPTATLLKSQKWFAKRKFEQLNSAPTNRPVVQDVHPEMDFCYAATNALMGRMSLKQFEEYQKFYHSLSWSGVNYPHLLVYLKASDTVLVDRAQRSAREFETIEPEYFLIMKSVNRQWLEGARKRVKILEIDTDEFDFSFETGKKVNRNKLKGLVNSALKLNTKPNGVKKRKQLSPNWNQIAKHKAVILCGMPGSGKSYIARKLKNNFGYIWLSSDKIRKQQSGQSRLDEINFEGGQMASNHAYTALYKTAKNLLRQEKSVVIDATNLKEGLEKGIDNLIIPKKDILVLQVKTSKSAIASRMKKKKGMATDRETYYQAWERVYGNFEKYFKEGKFFWPNDKKLGVKVVEIWNQ